MSKQSVKWRKEINEMGGNIPGENFLGSNFPGGGSFRGEILMGANFSGGNSSGEIFLEPFSSCNVSVLIFKRLSTNIIRL